MVVLQHITPQIASSYKSVRLRALRDSPSAFGSTYQRECQFSEQDWLDRVANLCSERAVGYLAFHQDKSCGIAACFLGEQESVTAQLISMWVDPAYRRTGVGRILVDAIAAWARDRGAHALQLMVTSSNDAAMEFYRRNGFSMTGHTEPYPNDPALIEHEMSRSIL